MLDNTILSNRSHYQGQTLLENILHEFQEWPKLITRQEKKIEWNKVFIVNLFEELTTKLPYKLSYHDREAGNISFEVCEKGTPYYAKVPLFKTEYIYPSKYSMEQLMEAFNNLDQRSKWDRNVASMQLVRKINRVELIKTNISPHPLDPQKRDIFEKKFGFSHRKGASGAADEIDNYFYHASLDSKEMKAECPETKEISRTHVYFGMQKFEIIRRPIKNK